MPESLPQTSTAAGASSDAERPRPAVVTVVLGAAWFLVGANIALVPPLLPFMAADLALTGWERGAVVAALPLASFAGNLLFGPMVDALGRRRCVIAGSAGVALLLAVSAVVGDGTAATVLRAATGLLMPLVGIAVFPCLADYVTPARRMALTGRVTAGGSLAQLVTVPAAIFLAAHVSWRWSFAALAAVAAGVCAAVVALLPRMPAPRPGPAGRFRALRLPADPGVRGTVFAFWLFTFALFAVTSFYPTWVLRSPSGVERSADAVTVLFVVSGIAAVVGAPLTGVVSRARRSRLAVLIAAPAVVVLALPVLAAALPAQAVLYALLILLQAVSFPLLRGRANALADDHQLSTVNAALNAGYQVAAAVAAAVAAVLLGWAPSFWLNSLMAAALFVGCAMVFFTSQRVRR